MNRPIEFGGWGFFWKSCIRENKLRMRLASERMMLAYTWREIHRLHTELDSAISHYSALQGELDRIKRETPELLSNTKQRG